MIQQAWSTLEKGIDKEGAEEIFALVFANKHRTKPITEAICDRGYRGQKEVNGTTICIPDTPKKKDTNCFSCLCLELYT